MSLLKKASTIGEIVAKLGNIALSNVMIYLILSSTLKVYIINVVALHMIL